MRGPLVLSEGTYRSPLGEGTTGPLWNRPERGPLVPPSSKHVGTFTCGFQSSRAQRETTADQDHDHVHIGGVQPGGSEATEDCAPSPSGNEDEGDHR